MSDAQCTFHNDRTSCYKVADPSGMYPRHALLVAEMGMKEALLREFGSHCRACDRTTPWDELGKCPGCETRLVCRRCRSNGVCCRYADDDKEDAED